MEPIDLVGKSIHEYGIAAVLAVLLVFIWWGFRAAYRIFLDPDKGIVIVTHREMITSVKSNKESNAINAAANAVHARAHERCSRALATLARRFPEIHDDDSDHALGS